MAEHVELDSLLNELINLPKEELEKLKDNTREVLQKTGMTRWTPNPGAQTEAYYCGAFEIGFGGEAGPGKELSLGTLLPTPTGWTTMGEVQSGDQLIDWDGCPCTVTFKSKPRTPKSYRLTFSDGSVIYAGADHQWITSNLKERMRSLKCTDEYRDKRRQTRTKRGKGIKPWLSERNSQTARPLNLPNESVKTTQEIVDTLLVKTRKQTNHSIRLTKSLQLPEAELLIEPYVLGAWLGDGSTGNGAISGIDEQIFSEVANYYPVSIRADKMTRGIIGLQKKLRMLGVLGNKHIPPAYLRASENQRLELLQGLMDTDGSVDKRDGSCNFTTTRRILADHCYELLVSLGIKARIREGIARLQGRAISAKYTINFITEKPAFKLARKLIKQKRSNFRGTHNKRYIISAEEVDPMMMQCVQVDSPSMTYLCGQSMIPTHNTALGIGIAISKHLRTLMLRHTNKEGMALLDEFEKFLKYRPKLDKNDSFKVDDRKIKIGGCDHENDKQKYKGVPYDLIFFDQVEDFTESQYRFIMQWCRSDNESVQPQVVCSLNPPTKSSGLWVINRWGPWLDPNHPRPAKSGEVRWFTMVDGEDTEMDGPGPHDIGEDKPVMAKSRTFIRGHLEENVALARTGYDATRAAAPEEMRSAYRDGDFEAALKDVPNQVIPTAWIRAAVKRWKNAPPEGIPMCAIGVDASGGGRDPMVLAIRHDGWFAPMIIVKGEDIPDDRPGKYSAGVVLSYRRDDADVKVDMGGGYGGPLYEQLCENGVACQTHIGAEKSTRRTEDGKLGFYNVRTEVYWRFREALDPSKPEGSPIMLPDDPLLIADLTAPTFLEDRTVLQLETKDKVVERLGRSPDRGDAVVIAWSCGPRYIQGGIALGRAQKYNYRQGVRPVVKMGRGAKNRRH